MQIGALSFRPYIYNTNTLSRASLSRISGIQEEDLTSSKTDYSGLTDAGRNVNPLKPGETSNFEEVLAKQMHMGQMNASRIMQPETYGELFSMNMEQYAM